MIEKVNGFRVGQQFFASIVEAQVSELKGIVATAFGATGSSTAESVAVLLVKESARVVDILTLTPRSLPKARKINGGTKKRKGATVPAPVAVVMNADYGTAKSE